MTRPLRIALAGLIAMAGAVGIGRFVYTPILPPMVAALGLSKGEAGLIASANYLGYLLGAFAAASPRLPGAPRAWVLGALALSAITTGAMGNAQSLLPSLVLRFVGGGASAFVLVLASTLVLEQLSAPLHRRLAALHFAGVGAGVALSAALTWAISAGGGDWRGMWYGSGGLSLAAVAAVAWLLPAAAEEPAPPGATVRAAPPPWLYPLVVAYGLFGFGYVITATFIVAIVYGSPAIQPMAPVVWLAFGLAAVPSVAAWSALGQRRGALAAFRVACAVEALGVVASVLWVERAGLLVSAVLLGGTFMGITALGLTAARELGGSRGRQMVALMTAAFGLGQILGPLVAGYGFDLTGSFLAPSLIAALALCVGAALTVPVDRRWAE